MSSVPDREPGRNGTSTDPEPIRGRRIVLGPTVEGDDGRASVSLEGEVEAPQVEAPQDATESNGELQEFAPARMSTFGASRDDPIGRDELRLMLAYMLRCPDVAGAVAGTLPEGRLVGLLIPEAAVEIVWNAYRSILAPTGSPPLEAVRVEALRAAEREYQASVTEGVRNEIEEIIGYVRVLPEAMFTDPSAGRSLVRHFLIERWLRDEFRTLGRGTDDIDWDRIQQIRDLIERCGGSAPHRPRISRPGARIVAEPVHWTVHALLKRISTLWFGPGKSLKSKLLLDFAVAVGTGGMTRALGHWQVAAPLDPGARGERALQLGDAPIPEGERVLYLVGEDEADEVEDMLVRICRARHTTEARCGVTLVYDPPSLSTGLSEVLTLVRAERSTVVVLDTASALNMMGDDAENVANMHVMVNKIQTLCRTFEAAGTVLWIAHHSTKWLTGRTGRENYEPMERNHVSGAGWAEAMKQVVMVNRSEPFAPGESPERVWLQVGNRSRSALWRVTLDEGAFNPRTGFRHSWRVTVETREEAEAADAERTSSAPVEVPVAQTRIMEAIVARLTAAGDWMARARLIPLVMADTRCTEHATRTPIATLESRGTIILEERGGRYFFRLAGVEPQPEPTRNLELADPSEGASSSS